MDHVFPTTWYFSMGYSTVGKALFICGVAVGIITGGWFGRRAWFKLSVDAGVVSIIQATLAVHILTIAVLAIDPQRNIDGIPLPLGIAVLALPLALMLDLLAPVLLGVAIGGHVVKPTVGRSGWWWIPAMAYSVWIAPWAGFYLAD